MEKIEVRAVRNRDELNKAYDIWGQVFREDRSFFQERLDYDNSYDMNTTWIAKVNGNIAASVQIFPYNITFENSMLKVGGIGSVGTLPEYRGRGLTQTIMRRQTDWMKSNSYDLSLLFTDINPFYQKVGWGTVPVYSYSLGISNIPEFMPDSQYDIKQFAKTDLNQIKDLYQDFCQNYIGTWIRSSDYWDGQLKWRHENPSEFLVAKSHEKVVAYLRVSNRDDILVINECCFQKGHENAVFILLKEMCKDVQRNKQIRITFAPNHLLTHYFQRWGAEKKIVTSEMWKVINLKGLLVKIKNVLTKRIYSAKKLGLEIDNCIYLIECGNSEILLEIKGDAVNIKDPSEHIAYNQLLKFNEREFISMLFNGAGNINIKGYMDDKLLNILFPAVPYNFWGTDSF
ncbi:GNAT family N-acetyltransferase [Bacillus sp. FJAT-49732]|uniref:GNAT family N-acetyltransferase n=1 Tax=Lederbergia citrisecunda TaxID=2833583 RepID=A0A942TPL3_9BACI|nr:GNAT family N-acetyltransferase [Lederbergia citrisecunda]MBS4200547.1 GNAT family N-acetyltransferase [Lederbergia citrisecunda]